MNGFYGQSVLATEEANFKFLVESLEADFINEEVMLEGLDFSKIKEKLKVVLSKIKQIFLKIVNRIKKSNNLLLGKIRDINARIKRSLAKITNKDVTITAYNISIDNSKLSIIKNGIKGIGDNLSKAADIIKNISESNFEDIKEEDAENVKKIKEELSNVDVTDNVDMEAVKKAGLEIFKVDGKEKVTGEAQISKKFDEYSDLIVEINKSTVSESDSLAWYYAYKERLEKDEKLLDELSSLGEGEELPIAVNFMKEAIGCDKVMLQIINMAFKNESKIYNYYLSAYYKYQAKLTNAIKSVYDDFDADFDYDDFEDEDDDDDDI
jgi:hypothetical protein